MEIEKNEMNSRVLCTLGPASMNDHVISRLEDLGVALFRINLSHTAIEDLENTIDFIQARTNVPICLDSEGAQVRSGKLENGEVVLKENTLLEVTSKPIVGNEIRFCLYPDYIVDKLIDGDFISVDFNSVLLQVVETNSGHATLRVLNGGKMGQNKAVSIERPIAMSPLTEKDEQAIKIGVRKGITNFALSFANYGSDVDEIRKFCGNDAIVISKIECRNGFLNLSDIAKKSDAILIDRGDLSREFPIERIPSLQMRIIEKCKAMERPVYVATNLLESMINTPEPTRAEVNDVITTLSSGATGLVLAAETAIGKWPVKCASMIVKLINSYNIDKNAEIDGYRDDPNYLLIEPHGGTLIQCETSLEGTEDYCQLPVEFIDIIDCEQIAVGTYSPIEGFMTHDELKLVLEENKLPNGTIWTMPILLQVGREHRSSLPITGERIALTFEGQTYALMDVNESYEIDLESVALKWFGTNSVEHPGVSRFMARGPYCLSGKITLVKKFPSSYRHYQLSPAQTRFLFSQKGWSRVVAFHTRNPPHRIHEYIQNKAMELTHSDGLYISPVIGPKKSGDFLEGPILDSYQMIIANGAYPIGTASLGSFATYSRFCGPREAVFTALARKNMGCSHFIVGRDHAGIGNFYDIDANQRFFDNIGDINITPVFFNNIGYNEKTERYCEFSENDKTIDISGTEVRKALVKGNSLPDWFMRKEVQKMLQQLISDEDMLFQQ